MRNSHVLQWNHIAWIGFLMIIIASVVVAVMMTGEVIQEGVMGVMGMPVVVAAISGTKTDGTGIKVIGIDMVTEMIVRTGTTIKNGMIEMSIGGILIVEMEKGGVMVDIEIVEKKAIAANRAITKGTITFIESGSVVNLIELKDIEIRTNTLACLF